MATQDLNMVALIGRLTCDAELRYTASGSALCNFSIAVNRRVKKGEQWLDEASLLDITLWGKQGENLNKYLLKGGQVAIQGSLKQDRWEKDGQKFSKVSVHVEDIQLLGGKPQGGNTGASEPQRSMASPQKPAAQSGDDFDPSAYEDDIQF